MKCSPAKGFSRIYFFRKIRPRIGPSFSLPLPQLENRLFLREEYPGDAGRA